MEKDIQLCLMEEDDREQFILDSQEAFNYGALEEFGCRDNHFEEYGQIISRETIEQSIDHGKVYRIILEEKKVGGAVIKVDEEKGSLDLLFVPQMLTVRELDLLRGVKLKSYIQKSKFGRL